MATAQSPSEAQNLRTSPGSSPAIILAVFMCIVALGVCGWRLQLGSLSLSKALPMDWEQVRERFPKPTEAIEVPKLEIGMFEAVLEANPFSPERRKAPVTAVPGEVGIETIERELAEPVFVYKGRIALGARERAILEDTATGKTHFLEVGQGVAGYKVLDILETRVVLSKFQTTEELVVELNPTSGP